MGGGRACSRSRRLLFWTLRSQLCTLALPRLRPSLQGGHYVAYVRAADQRWYLCDDAWVTACECVHPELLLIKP